MGLEWGDIDNDYIHIRRAINAHGITTTGKNETAARDFPQTKHTREILECQKMYRIDPKDPHERILGIPDNYVTANDGVSIVSIMVYLTSLRMNCGIPFHQSIKTNLALGFTKNLSGIRIPVLMGCICIPWTEIWIIFQSALMLCWKIGLPAARLNANSCKVNLPSNID